MSKKFKIKSLFLLTLILLSGLSCFAQKAEKIQLNKRPLLDLAETLIGKVQHKDLDLNASFLITVEGVLDKNGRLDTKTTKFTRSEGDKEMIEVAKDAVAAINDSGFFRYLENLESNKIIWTLGQDDKQIFSSLESVQNDESKAKSIAAAYKSLISVSKNIRKGKDEEILLNNLQVTSQGKNVIFNVAMPKEIAQEMIQRKLAELSQSEKTPNGK